MYAYKVDAFICYYCCNKLPKMWWFQKTADLLFHSFEGQKYGGNLNFVYKVSFAVKNNIFTCITLDSEGHGSQNLTHHSRRILIFPIHIQNICYEM